MIEEGVHGESFNSKPFKASMDVNSKQAFKAQGFTYNSGVFNVTYYFT